jgi:Tol biopolymer transport system component
MSEPKTLIGERLGHFEVTAAIGSGGMGEVWRAVDTRLGREVALKVLPEELAADPERLSRFEREAKVLASLNHSNIATLYGVESAPRSPTDSDTVLVMELVDGEDLSARLERGPMPLDQAIPIAVQIAEALEAAHEQGIVHRDLKPANVKATADGTVKVLDFGLATEAAAQTGSAALTMSPTLSIHATAAGVILGTAAYMSPEQARGSRVDSRSDIWSFGVLLWEMLTGRRLFEGDTVSDVLAAVLRADPDLGALPATTPARVRKLIHRCLERDPRQRLQAIGEARIVLTGPEPQEDPAEADERPRWPGRTVAVTVAAALLALTAGWLARGPGSSPAVPVAGMVLPHDDLEFAFEGPHCASISVSPDGRWMTFSAGTPSDEPSLWLRPVGDTAARALPGTQGASFPFWSPDSREVGFFANGSLHRVAVDAPASQVVCDAPDGRAGAWNREGVILFSPTPESAIYRVAAGGGEPVAVTELDAEAGETTHRWARFLPDGRHFVFTAGSHRQVVDGPANAIWVADLETGERERLVTARSRAVYASEYLLWGDGGALRARSFDAGRRKFTGPQRTLLPAVGMTSAYFVSDFDASTAGVLAFREGSVSAELQLHWVELDSLEVGEPIGEPAAINEISVSPDGVHAALVIADQETSRADLWVHDLERDVRSRLTFNREADVGYVVWSPDSRRLVYSLKRGGGGELRTVDLDRSSDSTSLLRNEHGMPGPQCFTPDGRQLLYTVEGDFWLLDVDTGQTRAVLETPAKEWGGTLSPDGRWLAYISNESGAPTPFVSSFPDLERRWQVANTAVSGVAWRSADRLWFVGDRGVFHQVAFAAGPDAPTLGRAKPAGSLENSFSGAVHPDGRRGIAAFSLESRRQEPIHLVAGWTTRLEAP